MASLPAGCQLSLYVRWHSAAGAVKVNRLPLDPIGGVEDLRGLFKCGGRAVDACNFCSTLAVLWLHGWDSARGHGMASHIQARQHVVRTLPPPLHPVVTFPWRRQLIQGAFPPGNLPDYLTSPAYYKFSPAEELISLPGACTAQQRSTAQHQVEQHHPARLRPDVVVDGPTRLCAARLRRATVCRPRRRAAPASRPAGDIARSEFRLVATLGDGWEYTVCERQLPGVPDPERRLLVTVSPLSMLCLVARQQG